MRAIRTTYQGVQFDSKLESQWARFYDALDMPWQYEKAKVELAPDLRYIPDFWLPSLRLWHETKGTIVNDGAGLLMIRKCTLLAEKTRFPAILTFDTPINARCALFLPSGEMHTQSHLGMCPVCGALGMLIRNGSQRFVICPHPNKRGLTLLEERHRRRTIYNAAISCTRRTSC
jgi:hypothetical protein